MVIYGAGYQIDGYFNINTFLCRLTVSVHHASWLNRVAVFSKSG